MSMCKKCKNCEYDGADFCRYQQKHPCKYYTPTDTKRENNILVAMVCVLLLIILLGLTGCSQTKYIVEYRDRVVTDTLVRGDSIYINQVHYIKEKGDTILKTDSIYIYQYKTLVQVHDSIVVDSIPYPVEVEKQVKYVPSYYHFTAWGFWICLALLLLLIAWRVYRMVKI